MTTRIYEANLMKIVIHYQTGFITMREAICCILDEDYGDLSYIKGSAHVENIQKKYIRKVINYKFN